MICEQARLPEMSTAQVARRYLLNANLLFKWLRDPAYAVEDQGLFLPIEILDEPPFFVPLPVSTHSEQSDRSSPKPRGRVEITTPSGFKLTVDGDFDGDAVGRLLKGLSS